MGLDLEFLNSSYSMVFYILVSFSFFVGILLLVAPEAYEIFNRSLQKEYGLKIKLIPKLEEESISVVDKTLMKYRIGAGLMISITAFELLLLYK